MTTDLTLSSPPLLSLDPFGPPASLGARCDTGFGRLVSERLAKAGAIVVAGCYTQKGRDDLQRAIPNALVLPLDVTSQASVDAFAAATLRKFPSGQIYALINNAFVCRGRTAHVVDECRRPLPPDVPGLEPRLCGASCCQRSGINICSVIEVASVNQFVQTFDVNVLGTIRVTKAFMSEIRQSRGRTARPKASTPQVEASTRANSYHSAHGWCRQTFSPSAGIINIASLAGTVALPGQAAYAASKHAVVGFTDALRRERAFTSSDWPATGEERCVMRPPQVMMRTPIVDDWMSGQQIRRDFEGGLRHSQVRAARTPRTKT